MGIRWTVERVAQLQELARQGCSAKVIAQEMGLALGQVYNAMTRYRCTHKEAATDAPTPARRDPVQVANEAAAARVIADDRKDLIDRLRVAEKRAQFWADLHTLPTPPAVPHRELRSGLREGTAIALLSDAHIEETVDPLKVANRNAYNLEISERRMRRFFDGVRWLISHNRKSWHIRDLVLWLGGDLITGYIHDELIESNALGPLEAILTLKRRLRDGIATLLADGRLEQLIIPCNYGNHGRMTARRRVKTGAENSLEWLLYNLLAEDYANEKRIRFEVPRGAHTYVQAYDYVLHFHHGDEVRYWGGVGGLSIPLNKRVPKWDNVKSADYHHIGHFHQLTDLGHTIVNGSCIGYTEYAFSEGCEFELPQQAFYILDSKRGKTNVCPIWVEESETCSDSADSS